MDIDYSQEEIAREIIVRLGLANYSDLNRDSLMVKCPVHGDKNPSCSISISKSCYNCFACHSHGTLSSLYYNITGHSIKKDLGIKTSNLPIRLWNKQHNQPSIVTLDSIPETHFKFNEIDVVPVFNDKDALAYIQKRGFSKFVVDSMNMKFAKNAISEDTSSMIEKDGKLIDKTIYFVNRLLIPVYEGKGTNRRLITVEGRDIYGEEVWNKQMEKMGKKIPYRKCIYPTGSSSNTLYEWEKLNTEKELFFTEGLMDVASMRTSSQMLNSTSTFGCAITERQLFLLRKFKKLTYVVNNDKAGWKSVKALKENLNVPFNVLVPPRGAKDVNDIITKLHMSIDEAIQKNWFAYKKPIEEYDVDQILKRFDN